MKSIKNLKNYIYILFSFLLIGVLGNTILTTASLVFEKNMVSLGYSIQNVPLSIKIIALFKVLSVFLFCFGAFQLVRMLKIKNVKEYLSNNSFTSLNKAGKLLILSGVIHICVNFSFFFIDFKYKIYIGYDINTYLLLTIIGLFFVFFSKILIKATEIKQENELTI